MRRHLQYLVFGLLGVTNSAFAMTECWSQPERAFSEHSSGRFFMFFASGGWGYVDISDPGYKTTVAMFTAALMADKQVVYRYTSDGVSCTSGPNPIAGLWMIR
jgi:hypothetical protein